ncbi:MAG: conjugal transfer protein TraG [Chitinophagaceae bacterium]|nr:conjugal transfer protein TraG [Chitinophagaceae bacterium]
MNTRPLPLRAQVDRIIFFMFLASAGLFLAGYFHPGELNNYKRSSLILLVLAVAARVPAKNQSYTKKKGYGLIAGGLLFYWSTSLFLLNLPGYISMAYGLIMIKRLMLGNHVNDVFNRFNETFPQEERLLENEFSFNLRAKYLLRGEVRKSWVNIINPFRGTLIIGSPGCGKTHFVIRQIIEQHIEKKYSLFIYDFKYPDLTNMARAYASTHDLHVISFDHLNQSSRCNPVDPSLIHDLMEAAESARTILLGLNPEWIKKPGDFWVESSVNLLTACLYYLRLYENGKYCTLPHVIELLQTPYEQLFSLLEREPQVQALIRPFITAFENKAQSQLEGQMAGVTISLTKLCSPDVYYILSGNDLTLDINRTGKPQILCMGNNPQKANIYGAIISLYLTALSRQLNQPGKNKCSLIFDEFASVYFSDADKFLATARSNKVATTMAIQDISQLQSLYGDKRAATIVNMAGNKICGQVTGETARQVSEIFGKTVQPRQSSSINFNHEVSHSYSTSLEYAVPASRIASLSSGEFAGIIADNPDQPVAFKTFLCKMYTPRVVAGKVDPAGEPGFHYEFDRSVVEKNFLKIRSEIKALVEREAGNN